MPPKSKIGESCITHKECANNNCVNGKCTRKKKSGNKSKSKSLKHSSPIQTMAKKQEIWKINLERAMPAFFN